MKEARLQQQACRLRGAEAMGCQYYWPSPHAVCGAIRDKYNSLGAQFSFLLLPTSPELINPDGFGRRSHFQNGPIYWSAATGAHPVVNSFLNRWGVHGCEGGWLGYPKSDEIVHADGVGRHQEFQGGAIYVAFQNAIGSTITGAIRDKWNTVGAETPGSLLGYPTSDEIKLPDGQGRMNRFERGVIYWHPSTGAHFVNGLVLALWAATGFEGGTYGYPLADSAELSNLAGAVDQRFQRGVIKIAMNAEDVNGPCTGNPSGCVPAPYDTLRSCREYLGAFGESGGNEIWIWKSTSEKYLQCGRYRNHIAPRHYSDPDNITTEDELNFRTCTNRTLNSSNTSSGAEGTIYTTRNNGVKGEAIVYYGTATISTSYTKTPGGNDWGGCVRDTE